MIRTQSIGAWIFVTIFALGSVAALAIGLRQSKGELWATLAVLAVFGGGALTFYRTAREVEQDRLNELRDSKICTECGYDLRATPDRCPECGAKPDVA